MKNIQLLNKISPVGTDIFDRSRFALGDEVDNPVGIMVRSASMHEMEFGSNLRAIARAGAGVNNIPVDKCADAGIVVFNTPGANANGVKELAIAALLMASRDIYQGITWANTLKGQEGVAKLVEKGKSQFAGCELAGKTLGVIGLGAIGGMVANIATHLQMKVVGYDPYLTVENAWMLSKNITKAKSYDEIYQCCDYITLHIPATSETKGMFCEETFAKMKNGVRIINLSRSDLVNSADMKAAVASGSVKRYVTDFPTDDMLGVDGIVTIPHLGASTAESEDNCAAMAAHELINFIDDGNIRNSVNFPTVEMPRIGGDTRVCVMHKNVPNMLVQISTVIADENINIDNMVNKSKKDYAYTMIDVSGKVNDAMIDRLEKIDGVIRVIVLK